MNTAAADLSPDRLSSSTTRWYVLIMTSVIYAINIADRYVVTTVLEPLRLELKLDDAGIGFLTGVPLGLFYVSCGLPLSWLADRSNRRNILAWSLIVWSLFTVACGQTRSYWHFLLARIGVGAGEAGGTPTSSSILSDYFPPARRPMAFTILALGAPVGAWLGAGMAARVADVYGWRAAFLVLGVPGLLVGLLVFLTIREPRRGRLDSIGDMPRAGILESLIEVWRQRAAFHVIMASGVCSLWGWGLIWWTPAFLMRTYGMSVGAAGAVTAPMHLYGGAAASIVTAWLLSRPFMNDPRRVLIMLAIGIGATTVPSFVAYWTHSLNVAQAMLWIFIPAIYFFIGPCMGLVQNLSPHHMRSMFVSWSVLVGNVFNLIVAPQAVGLLSHWHAHGAESDADSLRFGLLVLAPTGFWAVVHMLLAMRTASDDQQRATGYVA